MGKRIRELRLAHGFSQEALARRLGGSVRAVQKWESSGAQPRGETLQELADLLGTTTADLLGFDELVAASELTEIRETLARIEQRLDRTERKLGTDS